MPSKKKKYNARFPPARIKKIMQTDEEVGKVAAPVPVIISRALELFVESLLTKAVQITSAKNAKTLSPAHLKQCILDEDRFDFLKDLVLAIPDVQGDGDEQAGSSVPSTPTTHQQHPPIFRSQSEVTAGSSSASSSTAPAGRKTRGTGRPRGRPRKNPLEAPSAPRVWPTRTKKSESEEESSDEEDDDEDDSSDGNDTTPVAGSSRNGAATTTTVLPTMTIKANNDPQAAAAAAAAAAIQFNAVQPNFYQEISNNGGGTAQPFQIQITLPPLPTAVESTATGVGNGLNPPPSSAADDEDYDT